MTELQAEQQSNSSGKLDCETLDIIHQDEYLIAIQKPAGLLVHKSPIDRHEKRYAMKILRNQIGQWVYPVHRLDKPTSGLLLFALDKDTAKHVSLQFEQHAITKEYLAIVRGHTDSEGLIDYPLKEIAAFKHLEKHIDKFLKRVSHQINLQGKT